jgi:chloramphenicol 3-O phosphotransferase
MGVDVIVLNGASSSGKTSLARAIQRLLPAHSLTFGIDSLITAMPLQLDGAAEGLLIHPDGRVEVGPAFLALEGAWRRGLAAMARSGIRLVLDEVLLGGGEEQRQWNETLAGLTVLWVGVRCDPDVLVAREAARGDRVVGMAALPVGYVHQGVVYDLEVDTSRASPQACAATIATHVLGAA